MEQATTNQIGKGQKEMPIWERSKEMPIWERSKRDANLGKVKRRCHASYYLPEFFLLVSTPAEQCVHHQEGP